MSSLGAATRIPHPHAAGVYALVGYDPALGFYVELRSVKKRPRTYDAISLGYDRRQPLWGALAFLSTCGGFYTLSQLEDALTYREVGGRKPRSKGALTALAAIAAMKSAADLGPTPDARSSDLPLGVEGAP